MANRKYEFTGETKLVDGRTLHRIRAIITFSHVEAGEIGGWIEAESNLSMYGDAWVCDDAEVYGNAKVYGNAWVSGNAKVSGNAWVSGNAEVYGNAKVSGNALVSGDAWVYGNAEVYGDAWVYGNAWVSGDAQVCGDEDYIVFKNSWSSMRWFTYTRSNRKWKVGCFYGTGDELVKKAYSYSEKSGKCYEAIVRAVEAIEAATTEQEE